jgi:hypothetical protein
MVAAVWMGYVCSLRYDVLEDVKNLCEKGDGEKEDGFWRETCDR